MTTPTDATVFHLCTRTAFEAARETGAYRAESLGREGFIHLSRAHQVLPTAQAYFRGVPDLVVLVIEAAGLGAALRYEPPAPLPTSTPKAVPEDTELYPHCYAPISLDAIVDVIAIEAFDPFMER